MTAEELKSIRNKFPRTADDGKGGLFADGVFEGGGVVGLAFLGAARCCAEVGVRWKGLAGTSAGAITASLLAAVDDNPELERLFASLDFNKFVGKKTSPLIIDFNPSNDLEQPMLLLARLLLASQLGEYSSEPVREWLADALKVVGVTTFADIAKGDAEHELKVVVSNISRGLMRVLPDDLPHSEQAGFSVAEAVRLSMSIPLFFAPGQLHEDFIVDGGILSNYPVWIYDEEDQDQVPKWPTFGFRLYDSRDSRQISIHSASDIVKAIFQTMRFAHDRHNLAITKITRTINVDVTDAGVTSTQFNLTNDQKDDLYRRGYECTKQFLLEHWDWEKHLQTRGYRRK
jgi:NTE family protein